MYQAVKIRSMKVIFALNEEVRTKIVESFESVRRERKYIRLHPWRNGELDDRQFDDRVEIWAEIGITNIHEAYELNDQFSLNMSVNEHCKLFEDFCEEVAALSGVKLR